MNLSAATKLAERIAAASETEEAIFTAIGLDFIRPEDRER